MTNLDQQGTTSSSSLLQIKFGFQTIETSPKQFCSDSNIDCPINIDQNVTLQRSQQITDIPLLPLADISAQYSSLTANATHFLCVQIAPVGYQHPTWRQVFLYLPIVFTASAAIISLLVSFSTFNEGEHDVFLLGSNYAMLPGVLRLKTPGFFDLVFYAQFVVVSGQFNIDYPRFYSLFISNFSWSFFLFSTGWLQPVISNMFPSTIDNLYTSYPGWSLYKRQEIDQQNITNTNSTQINVGGTSMGDFALAVGIDINALFFTFMVYMLIIAISCVTFCLIVWSIFYFSEKSADNKSFERRSKKMWDFTIGILVRLLTLAYLPQLTFAFYQFMIPSRWYLSFLAAIFLVIPLAFFGFLSIQLLQIRPASFVFSDMKLLLRYGSLYNMFTYKYFYFFVIIISYRSITAAMIGLFQTSGVAQLVVVLVSELALLVGQMLKSPYADKQVNIQHCFFGAVRIVVLILNIPYIPQIESTVLNKQYVGYIQVSIHMLALFFYFILQIKNLIMLLTGLGDEELGESSKPPAHMVIWKKKNNSSSAALMASTSHSRNPSQSTSLLLGTDSQDGSKRHTTNSYTVEMLQAYYNPTPPSKPDDIQATTSQTTLSTRTQHKESQMVTINQLVYPIDNEPSTSSQPLVGTNSKITQKPVENSIHRASLENTALTRPSSPPPKLPEHKEFEYFSS
ncbi:hypothetical protein K501DRAFT_205888 [Backusella circina FSU 941]|nr:hypothetical protein K501DRAFT_205888 [Backusella circina FSU 941]